MDGNYFAGLLTKWFCPLIFEKGVEYKGAPEETLTIDAETAQRLRTISKPKSMKEAKLERLRSLETNAIAFSANHSIAQSYMGMLTRWKEPRVGMTEGVKLPDDQIKLSKEASDMLKTCALKRRSLLPNKLENICGSVENEVVLLCDTGDSAAERNKTRLVKAIPLPDGIKLRDCSKAKYGASCPYFLSTIPLKISNREIPNWMVLKDNTSEKSSQQAPASNKLSDHKSQLSEEQLTLIAAKFLLQQKKVIESICKYEHSNVLPKWEPPLLQSASIQLKVFKDEETIRAHEVLYGEDFEYLGNNFLYTPDSSTVKTSLESRSLQINDSTDTQAGTTIQDISQLTMTAENADQHSLKRNTKDNEDDLSAIITKLSKKKQRTIAASLNDDDFPLGTVFSFENSIESDEKSKGETSHSANDFQNKKQETPLKLMSLKACEGIKNKHIIANLDLFHRRPDLFEYIQQLGSQSGLHVETVSTFHGSDGFGLYLNAKCGLLTFSSQSACQIDVYTGQYLLIQKLMKIAYECKEIILVMIQSDHFRDQNSLNPQLKEILLANNITVVVCTSDTYLDIITELIRVHAGMLHSSKFSDEDIAYFESKGISNCILVNQLMSETSLKSFLEMTDTERKCQFENIITYELLDEFSEAKAI